MATRAAVRRGGIWNLVVAVLLTIVCGCDGGSTVSGKITYQGKPVVYGSVIMVSADNTARSGVILPDGSYRVDGVHPGEVSIGVISHDPAKGRTSVATDKPPAHQVKKSTSAATRVPGWFPLPAKYENPAGSGLHATIDSGRVTHDIELQ